MQMLRVLLICAIAVGALHANVACVVDIMICDFAVGALHADVACVVDM